MDQADERRHLAPGRGEVRLLVRLLSWGGRVVVCGGLVDGDGDGEASVRGVRRGVVERIARR